MMDELGAGDGRFIRPDPMIASHDAFFCCLLLLPSSVAFFCCLRPDRPGKASCLPYDHPPIAGGLRRGRVQGDEVGICQSPRMPSLSFFFAVTQCLELRYDSSSKCIRSLFPGGVKKGDKAWSSSQARVGRWIM